MKVDAHGKPARTVWRILGRGRRRDQEIAWLQLQPHTGRTHQLRVHCAAMAAPILGDRVYGRPSDLSLQLLARKVVVPLIKNDKPVTVVAPVPPHMFEMLSLCGWAPEEADHAHE